MINLTDHKYIPVSYTHLGMKKAFLKHEELERISKLSANLMSCLLYTSRCV